MTMTEVHCIGGGQVTEEQMRFFLSSEQVLIKYYGGSKLQWRKLGLKLSELHRHISPDTHTSYATFAHHACTDVDMTWEIFQYYMLHAPSELLAWTNQSGGKSVKSMFHIRKKEVIDAKSRV